MSTDAPTQGDDLRDRLDRRVGGPPVLEFPDGWTLSDSWYRAQLASANVGSHNEAEWGIVLGHPRKLDPGGYHRVLFALLEGNVVAECDCDGYRYRGFCAHVAHLWWRWVRGKLAVSDLDTGETHLYPPAWLSVAEEGGEQR